LEDTDIISPYNICLLTFRIACNLKLITVGHLKDERNLFRCRVFTVETDLLC